MIDNRSVSSDFPDDSIISAVVHIEDRSCDVRRPGTNQVSSSLLSWLISVTEQYIDYLLICTLSSQFELLKVDMESYIFILIFTWRKAEVIMKSVQINRRIDWLDGLWWKQQPVCDSSSCWTGLIQCLSFNLESQRSLVCQCSIDLHEFISLM